MLKNYIIEQFASMSDEFGRCFKDAITLTGQDIRFDGREKDRRIIFTPEIPYPFLKDVYKILQEGIECSTATSGENSLTVRHYGKTSSSATSPNEDETSSSSTAKRRFSRKVHNLVNGFPSAITQILERKLIQL